MVEKTFVADAKERRKKKVQELTTKVLAKMLTEDVNYLDTHYIQDRTLEILERTKKKLKFSSEEIQKARKAFLDVLIDGAKKQIYTYNDDYELAKKNLKIKSEKAQAKEVLRQIERIQQGNPEGATEERNMKCEPVCQMIAQELFTPEMINDDEFIAGCIEEENETLLEILYRLAFEELFDQLVISLDRSYMEANEINWGAPRNKISLKMIDNRLKKK